MAGTSLLVVDELSQVDQFAVSSFRAAADQVHHFFWPVRNHQLKADLFRHTEPDRAELFPEPVFRSIALAVRLAYSRSEAGRFDNILGILGGVREPMVAAKLERIRKDWSDALSGQRSVIFELQGTVYSPRQVFDTWLNAQAFHQDMKRQPDVAALRDVEPLSSLALQLTVRQLAIAVLNLDSLLRYVIGASQRDFSQEPDDNITQGLFWDPV